MLAPRTREQGEVRSFSLARKALCVLGMLRTVAWSDPRSDKTWSSASVPGRKILLECSLAAGREGDVKIAGLKSLEQLHSLPTGELGPSQEPVLDSCVKER